MVRAACAASGLSVAILTLACAGEPPRPAEAPAEAAPAPVTISIVGTNDLHGRVRQLPWLGGYLSNLRRARERDGGVLLLDAGDMFQGTLESNLGEGDVVVRAYEALGYDAVAIGNHEFDFGPLGEATTPKGAEEDARGALKARAAGARFPFLAANLLDASTGKRVDWPNVPASLLVRVGGVDVGVVGVTTEDTPRTTIAANFRGLRVAPLGETLSAEAARLREKGAAVVVAVAHAGSRCQAFSGDVVRDACELDAEIFRTLERVPDGAVDVVVAGHTHAGVAHEVLGVAVIESHSYGRAFGRVDLVVDPASKRVLETRIHAPRELCARGEGDMCEPGAYEGAPVLPDPKVTAVIEPGIARARERRETKLGVDLEAPILRAYGEESALGNLFADLLRESAPGSDVGLVNGGALRADLPAGPLTYGALFEASPFDNRLARVAITGADLRAMIAHNLVQSMGIFSLSGVRARAACKAGRLEVELRREDGRAIRDDERLTLAMSDFLATGGDGVFGPVALEEGAVDMGDGLIRDAMAERLRARSKLRAADLFSKERRRLAYPGPRPVRCPP